MMGGMIMVRYRLMAAIWLGLCILALGSCARQPTVATSQAQIQAVGPGMARVWFFRQADPTGGNVYAGAPIIYANGVPVGELPQGTVFFHDFPPGKHRFTVQPYGTPTREHDTLQLAPGTDAYVQVQWEANWEAGHTGGGSSFTVLTSSPEVAQQYLPTLTNLGAASVALFADSDESASSEDDLCNLRFLVSRKHHSSNSASLS
jgi:hypothetical protein